VRLSTISTALAGSLQADEQQAKTVAYLSKADLLTNMVGEFPELQGIMGKYYALHAKEPKAVAQALEEQYLPRFSQDKLPRTKQGIIIALSDRIDNIIGVIGLSAIPSGDKDPFALKRQALAIMRIIIHHKLPLCLTTCAELSVTAYGKLMKNTNIINEFVHFCFERLKAFLLEKKIPATIFEAVRVNQITAPYDFYLRIQAVMRFLQLPEATSLSAANKRVKNILNKQELTLHKEPINTDLLIEPAEKQLVATLHAVQEIFENLYQAQQYGSALEKLTIFKEPIDLFFEQVMVMTEDKNLQANRLQILLQVHTIFTAIADISLL